MEEEKHDSGDEGANPYADGPVEEFKVPGQGNDDQPGQK